MISFRLDGYKFNFRVGCIIISSDNRVLLNTDDNKDFWILPGGRVLSGEDTKTAINREIKEELGLEIYNENIKVTMESFFRFRGQDYHELQYVYTAKLKTKFIEYYTYKFCGHENQKFKWFKLEELENIRFLPAPLLECVKESLKGDKQIKHFTYKEQI